MTSSPLSLLPPLRTSPFVSFSLFCLSLLFPLSAASQPSTPITSMANTDITESTHFIGANPKTPSNSPSNTPPDPIPPPTLHHTSLPTIPIYGKPPIDPSLFQTHVARIVSLTSRTSPITSTHILESGFAVPLQKSDSSVVLVSVAHWLSQVDRIWLVPNTKQAEIAFNSFRIQLANLNPKAISKLAHQQHWIPLYISSLDSPTNLLSLSFSPPPKPSDPSPSQIPPPTNSSPKQSPKQPCLQLDFSNISDINPLLPITLCSSGIPLNQTPVSIHQSFSSFQPLGTGLQTAVRLLPGLDSIRFHYLTSGCPILGAPLIRNDSTHLVAICSSHSLDTPQITLAIPYPAIQHFLNTH